MKKIFDRLTALVMVMLMFIQSCVPAITSFAKEEELDKRYVIQKLETLKQDTYANFSLNLATVIDDKNLDTDTNVKFVLNTTNINSNIKLLVRKDFSLYDERTFDTVEEAHKEFDRVDKSLKDQGLSLDVSVVQEDGKYRIHNNYVPQADKEDFGDDYKVYSLKVVDEFDFDKEGLFNKLPENLKSTEQHRLQLAEERRLQQDGEVPEGDKHNRTYIFDFKVDKAVDSKLTTIALNKDDNNPLEVKQNADLFAAILDDKTYSTYQTEQLPAEVTSSIEHKKEVAEAKAKAEADAKAKAEADAKAKAEAEEKAKKEAEEKAKADAKAKEEADAKAKQEADAKAKQEAEKIKAEEAKKTEEQKVLDEKAKQEADAKAKAEADAKAKAEAEAKQKAEAEEKAKQEELAKKQAEAEAKKAAEEKAKKDLENKKLLGLVQDTEENQEEEPIIKKKETTEEVKKEPATPEERKQKAEEFDKALQDKKEDIKKSEDKKDANNKEDNKKTADKKEVSKETKGLLEGIKEFFGLTNLQKADRELKAILSVKANGLKEVQALLSSFEEKYHLTKEEQAKLMEDNKDAIKALIEKDADKNFNPQMLINPVGATSQGLSDKKYTIITRFDVSRKAGPIQEGQSFTIKLDDRLTVKYPNTLKPIVNNGKTIATPSYDKDTNSITYTIAEPISDDLQIPLSIDVDYNVEKIKKLDGDATKHSIKNSITGIGVTKAVSLPETVVDNDGKIINQIIEPGSKDVLEIVDQGEDYQVHMDVSGSPIVKDGELESIDWTVRFSSTKDLLDLGLISNATLVKGSGLSRYENITINGKPINKDDITTNEIEGKLGIRESKNYTLKDHTKDVTIKFQTPVFNKQQKYMIDFSVLLKNRNNKSGAVRLVFDKGYTDEQVKEKTSKRIGMNNRTTIMGEFTSENTAKWTVTDGVSTADANNGLPLATRDLTGAQRLDSSRMAVYGIDETTGKMVIKTVNPDGDDEGTNITGIPDKETNPSGGQAPGTIAVYEYDTSLTDSNAGYSLAGVNINKYQDLTIKQTWAGIDSTKKMPAQGFVVKDESGKAISPEIKVSEGETGKAYREITIPAAKYWDIKTNADGSIKESKTNQKIEQSLPKDTTIGGTTYSYKEKYNYLAEEDGAYHIYNVMAQSTQEKDADFTVLKFDSKDPSKKLEGAKFTLQSPKETIELLTDANGRASFSNVSPGTYTLIENKAPNGYKLDTTAKQIRIDNDGKVSVSGDNIAMQGGKIETELDHHQYYPSYPSFMNALHYGKIDDKGNIEFYIHLKPEANGSDGYTNKNTRLNLNVLGGEIKEVQVLDVEPGNRNTVKNHMYNQTADKYTGNNLINAGVENDITGQDNITDGFTGKAGYQIKFPAARFGGQTNDWGFLVKVKATGSDSTAVSYDWLTDTDRVKDEARIQESIGLSTSAESGVMLNIANDPFPRLPVEVTKIKEDKSPLANATFRLRDANNQIISDVKSGADGKASFGELSPGNYTIEEISAPSGYQKSQVIFDVHVGEDGKVIYKARFKDGAGTPKNGVDYIIEEIETGQEGGKATVTGITQSMILQEKQNQPNDGRLGWTEGVWEAYGIESYRYKANFLISNAKKGGLFKIQFDPNLDFRRYVYEIPELKDATGKVLAKPYFNYETNLLTYQFTDNIDSNAVNASLEIIGIIPDKYYATQTNTTTGYNFRIVVDPDNTTGTSNPTVNHPNIQTTQSKDKVLPFNIKTDYYSYDSQGGSGPLTSEYIYDVYKDKNGDIYLKAMSYYNPTGLTSGKRTLRYDWISMNRPVSDLNTYKANGYPAFGFQELEVYKVTDTPENKQRLMPLSYGIRPDQDPRNYDLVYSKNNVNPQEGFRDQVGDYRITYDPSKLKSTELLTKNGHNNHPLEIDVPRVEKNEGYVVIQTFKVTDVQRYKNLWSAYYLSNGSRQTGSYQKGNANIATGSETGQEIPKFYTEKVKLFNKTYKPGQFKIEKLNEADRTKKLQGATFSLTNESDGHVIYRSSDADGIVDFTDIEPGEYILEESEAPNRYTKSTKKWRVTVYDTGNVLIREIGITGTGSVVEGTTIKLPVTNKPVGEKFQVYKKNGNGQALPGAEFAIYDKDEKTVIAKGTSDTNGIVDFKFEAGKSLEEGQKYILKETKAPKGYKPIDKKWVLEVKDGKTKVYNYVASTGSTDLKSFLAEDNVNWVDVKNRSTEGWSDYDNRWTGWTGNSKTAQYMGTRIIAINKKDGYAIQRYVINPEARNLGQTTASIHRQDPRDPNMTWYNGSAEYKVFELDKPVTGLISDLRLANYTTEDITGDVKKTAKSEEGRYGEPKRLNLTLPATSRPIVIDVKVPYINEDGGVGTGMDWLVDNSNIYWKADYYESVQDMVVGDPTKAAVGDIKGSYISEGSLDVNNEKEKFQFKLKKVKEGTNDAIKGAVFKLTGPEPLKDERYMTTGSDGMITFAGLEAGKYKLEEYQPAPGYEGVDYYWIVTIANDGTVSYREVKKEADTYKESVVVQDITKNIGQKATEEEIKNAVSITGYPTEKTITKIVVDPAQIPAGDKEEVKEVDVELTFSDESKTTVKVKVVTKRIITDSEKYTVTTENLEKKYDGRSITLDALKAQVRFNPPIEQGQVQPKITLVEGQNLSAVKDIGTYPIQLKITYADGSTENVTVSVTITGQKNNEQFQVYISGTVEKELGQAPTSEEILAKVSTNYLGAGKVNKEVIGSIPNGQNPGEYKVSIRVTYPDGSIDETKSVTVKINDRQYPEGTYKVIDSSKATKWYVNGQNRYDGEAQTRIVEVDYKNKTFTQVFVFEVNSAYNTDQPIFEIHRQPLTSFDQSDILSLEFNKYPTGTNIDNYSTKRAGAKVATTKSAMGTDRYIIETGRNIRRFNQPLVLKVKAKLPEGADYSTPFGLGADWFTYGSRSEENFKIWVAEAYKGGLNEVGTSVSGTFSTRSYAPISLYSLRSNFIEDNNLLGFRTEANETPLKAKIEGIQEDGTLVVTNKQVGIELKVHKRNNINEGLEGANFTLKKYTDKSFTEVDGTFTDITATSDKEGNVVFKDKDDKIVKLNTGYYILEETKSPVGYKKAAAPWKLQVKEENGSLVIVENGPENTAASFLTSDKAVAANDLNGKIKYKSIVKNIDPDSKTFVQRVYIDTRAYGKVVNVQITPKHKREEIDRPGEPPVTITEGVKTAYRSTYQITNPPADVDVDKVLNSYDLRDPNVKTVNTARWRPFDWGFDEDLLNLEPGVYYIDIEGYYDGSIVDKKVTNEVNVDSNYNFIDNNNQPSAEPVKKAPYERTDIPQKDLGKIELHFDFFDGAREFRQLYDKGDDYVGYKYKDKGSYQGGMIELRNWIARYNGTTNANYWANNKPAGQKYKNALSKEAYVDTAKFAAGIIYPSVAGTPAAHVDTSLDISSLYTSDKLETVPQEGMSITNEKEVYNITFSKHKMDGDDNTNRLEGAVFKLQKKEGSFWYDMDESYVSSAFNGYFGFRRLEPGTYRLLEVAPPEGYRALDGTLLEFVIKTIDPKGEIIKKDDGKTYDKESGLEVQVQPDGTHKVVDPKTGKIVESANGYVTIEYKRDNYLIPNVKDDETSTGKLVDFVTSATAKNIGKVRNEEPGKGSVTIKKVDENGKAIPGKKNESGDLIAGAKFRATRLGAKTDKDGNPVTDAVYEGYVDEKGTLKLEGLPLGNYELREIESPNGYINTGHVWHFTVGGKGLDPYADDASPRTRNITSLIELTSSDMIVNRPYDEDTTQGTNEIRPHVGQSLQFTNKYNIKDGVKISAGDYFVLKLTDNMDLHGIREDKPTNLDLFADGIGTLAKADYNRQAGTITYTFTKAAEQYTVTDFKNVISSHINLNRVRNSSYQKVGMSIGNDTKKLKDIYVNYIVSTEYDNDGYNYINMASKIVSFNSDTGEFVHYFYINREGQYDGKNLTFRYKPNQTVNNLQITTYDLYYTDNNSKIQSMPASFGVNENDRNLWRYGITQPKTVEANKTTTTNIGNYPYNRASIVKVTGKIANTKNLTEYRGNSALYYGYNYTDNYGYQRWAENPSVYRWDGVYVFENESTAKANFELPITNPSNKVVFEKVNTEGQVLKPTVDETGKVTKGAKFTLEKNDGTIENPAATWTAKTNPTFVDKDGRISYNHLEKGLYRLIENEAPEGYANPNGPVAYLKVDDSGKIYQKVTVPNADGTGTAEIYQEISETIPIKVVNNKPIEFVKVDADDNGKILPGAEFKVLYKEKLDDKYKEYKVDGKTLTGTSEKDGKFSLNISKDGYYALEETKAPDGYSKFPGYIKEFKLEKGKIQVLEKDPLKASKTIGANGMIKSEILEVDKDKGTFKQRIILNPNHTSWKFDAIDTQLRIVENGWKVNSLNTIRTAILPKDKSIDQLTNSDYSTSVENSERYLNNEQCIRYQVRDLYRIPWDPNVQYQTRTDSVVVEVEGKLNQAVTNLNLKSYIQHDLLNIDTVNSEIDINNLSSDKGKYINYESQDPIQVENRKGEYPHTGALGIIGFLVVGAVMMATAYYKYRRKKRESALS
ncbi:hypothetical protein GKF99_05465 [Finegoldia sp. BIOML-A2]|uniref:SpaA isopeptide-forming pilin-related protein n=1 Tax=unclassified Finegoldia TaxID=2619637 RepID=UPI0012AF46BD|nr:MULTISPECIES: SpaA isopeptide-forming pilin-related protein [unclassified Finegoldia]MSA97975.1 hypothetical protein [Finegoldia sp. BIOML-A5]MSB00855.1 hypothetical protein [Finegoldia sp. BIOML-A2]